MLPSHISCESFTLAWCCRISPILLLSTKSFAFTCLRLVLAGFPFAGGGSAPVPGFPLVLPLPAGRRKPASMSFWLPRPCLGQLSMDSLTRKKSLKTKRNSMVQDLSGLRRVERTRSFNADFRLVLLFVFEDKAVPHSREFHVLSWY